MGCVLFGSWGIEWWYGYTILKIPDLFSFISGSLTLFRVTNSSLCGGFFGINVSKLRVITQIVGDMLFAGVDSWLGEKCIWVLF